jgi:hypothetical protein
MTTYRTTKLNFFSGLFKKSYKGSAKILIEAMNRRGNLRSVLTVASKKYHAHHVIPIEALQQCRLVQLAVLGGFKINGTENGMIVSIKTHKKFHASLNNSNRTIIGDILRIETKGMSHIEAAKKLRELVTEYRALV